MKLGEVGVSQYTQLVCIRVFLAWGNVQKRLCHNLQDQYSCGDAGRYDFKAGLMFEFSNLVYGCTHGVLDG